MRVFLDANILFSASDESSATRQLLDEVLRHGKALTSPHVMEEARRNLERKRAHVLLGLSRLGRCVTVTHAFRLPADVPLPEKDKPVLAGAVGSRCTHLWTSDRLHFGSLYGKVVHGVRVVSSLMLAEDLNLIDTTRTKR